MESRVVNQIVPAGRGSRLSQAIDTENSGIHGEPLLHSGQISVIVPVRDNCKGAQRFLRELFRVTPSDCLPKEVVLVDNLSFEPLKIKDEMLTNGVPVRVVSCDTPGAAAARNMGVKCTSGSWLLFCDSDCIPTESTIAGYFEAKSGAVAYAGHVRGTPSTRLTFFYDSEGTLLPHFKRVAEFKRPLYIVTANCLVERRAFVAVGGFNTEFYGAGGEDVELGMRLWRYGRIEYIESTVIDHDFSDGIIGFAERFIRYGKGNFKFYQLTGVTMKPRLKMPKVTRFSNIVLIFLQYIFLWIGYTIESKTGSDHSKQGE